MLNQFVKKQIWQIRWKIDCHRFSKQVHEHIGCGACKHYFYYDKLDMCACKALEMIDYGILGTSLDLFGDCEAFEFDGYEGWSYRLYDILEEEDE